MGPEPLPRGQYPVSILFVIIIQVDGRNEARNVVHRLLPMEVPKGETIHRSNRECGSTMKAGQSKPRGMRE
jgi:hypothetical protein